MRRREMISLVVVGILLAVPAAVSVAGDWHRGDSSGMYGPAESPSSMGSADTRPSWDPESLEYREALETGKLPPPEGSMSSGGGSPSGEEIRTVEAGGLWFRQGIDTGP